MHKTQDFSEEYQLSKQKKIKLRDINLFVAPRYVNMYAQTNYEDYTIDLLLRYFQNGETFVDIGAHYGIYSLMVGKHFKNSKITAVEPLPNNSQTFLKNVSANNLKGRIDLKQLAVSDRIGSQEINVTEASDSVGFYSHPLAETIGKIEVKTTTLDRLMPKSKKVGIIKIDTEGHEIHVLKGMEKVLKNNPQVKLIVELNPESQKMAGFRKTQLLKRLDELGFSVFLIDDYQKFLHQLKPPFNNVDRHFRNVHYVNLWCVPKKEALSITFFSHTAGIGGSERSLLSIIDYLQEKNVLCNVVVPHQGPMVSILRSKAVSVITTEYAWISQIEKISLGQIINKNRFSLKKLAEVLLQIKKLNSDIIFSNTSVIPWGSLAASVLKKPHMWRISEHGEDDHNLIMDIPYQNYTKYIFKNSNHIIANSQNLKNRLRKIVKTNTITTVYPSSNVDRQESNEKFSSPYKIKNSFRLLQGATFNVTKGQMDAVKAVHSLIKQGKNVELVLMGKIEDRKYYSRIKKYIKKNKLQYRIHILAFSNIFPEYIKASHCLLLCSRYETFGLVILEAMKLNKVVIASKQGEAKIIIESGENGLLYSVGDSQDLSDQIKKILENKKLYKSILNNTRTILPKIVNKYPVSKIYPILMKLKKVDNRSQLWVKLLGSMLLGSSVARKIIYKLGFMRKRHSSTYNH